MILFNVNQKNKIKPEEITTFLIQKEYALRTYIYATPFSHIIDMYAEIFLHKTKSSIND